MRWALTLSGTHAEGLEAEGRFDKIVAEFSEKLHSNGFQAGFTDSTLDVEDEAGTQMRAAHARAAHKALRDSMDREEWKLRNTVPEPPSEVLERFAAEDEALKPANVAFASDEAGELAVEKGLTTRNFQGLEPSSTNGFTVLDVKNAAKRAGK